MSASLCNRSLLVLKVKLSLEGNARQGRYSNWLESDSKKAQGQLTSQML